MAKNLKITKSNKSVKKINPTVTGRNRKNVSIIIILGFLAILAIVALYLIISQNNTKEYSQYPEINNSIYIHTTVKEINSSECISKSGITENVIYIYSDDCVYSQRNTPWVKELISQGERIRMISTSDTEELLKVMNCILNFELEGTPTYLCIKNMSTHKGIFNSESELIKFINDCK